MRVVRGSALALSAFALIMAGCTSVTVIGEAKVEQRSYLGGVSVQPVSAQPVRIRISGLGVTQTHSGVSLGWVEEDSVLLGDPDACRIVVILDNSEAEDAGHEWLDHLLFKKGDLCIAK